MSKRAKGTGSIYRLKNGNWRALVTVQGRRISHTEPTKKAASDWAVTTTTQIEQGLTYGSTQTRFDKFLDGWLETKSTGLRTATQEQYRRLTRLYIKPGLGPVIIKDLNAARIQAFIDGLKAETGLRTIELCYTVLHGCLKHAQRLGLVSQNWAELVEVPRPEKREMSVWDEGQVSLFLSTVDDPLYRMAFATGMRRGELIGLQWRDLDWQSEAIQVRRQVITPEGGGWRFQEPKTARGRRAIRLGPGLLEALRRHFNQTLLLARAIAGDRWQESDLIFPSQVGTPRNGYEVSKAFHRLAEQAGLPAIRFHDIRHTAASIMLLHREPPVRVAAILGQSLAVLMDTYAHYIPDDQERAAALMDAITTPVKVDFEAYAHDTRTK
jgi:integrase